MCGKLGHLRNDCEREVCFNCSKAGHVSRNCPLPRKRRAYADDLCEKCRMPGHYGKDCPLNWRRYKYTKAVPVKRVDLNRDLKEKILKRFCYNCGKKGHFGDDCDENRLAITSAFHLPTMEYVLSADIMTEYEATNYDLNTRSNERNNERGNERNYERGNERNAFHERRNYQERNNRFDNYRRFDDLERNYHRQKDRSERRHPAILNPVDNPDHSRTIRGNSIRPHFDRAENQLYRPLYKGGYNRK